MHTVHLDHAPCHPGDGGGAVGGGGLSAALSLSRDDPHCLRRDRRQHGHGPQRRLAPATPALPIIECHPDLSDPVGVADWLCRFTGAPDRRAAFRDGSQNRELLSGFEGRTGEFAVAGDSPDRCAPARADQFDADYGGVASIRRRIGLAGALPRRGAPPAAGGRWMRWARYWLPPVRF